MFKIKQLANNNHGSVINIALFVIVLLALIAISAIKNSSTEIKISNNIKSEKVSFYNADGGTEIASELLENNIACDDGFTETTPGNGAIIENSIQVDTVAFWKNLTATIPSDSNRDFYYPHNYSANESHINFKVGGNTDALDGSSNIMNSGYEGIGRSLARGGSFMLFDVYSQYVDSHGNKTNLAIQWRHLIGQENSCQY
jgi:hypothetical protein